MSRKKVENLVYEVLTALEGGSTKNADYYKEKFSKMDDKEFTKWIENNDFRITVDSFDIIEMNDISKALNILGVPMYESVNLPYKYKDKNGNPVQSEPCVVGYINVPRLRQINEKKSANGTDMTKLNPKTGEYTQDSKVVAITDRELEGSAAFKLDNILKEFYTMRSDDIEASNTALSEIRNKGSISLEELPENSQNLSREYLYWCLTGAQLESNIIKQI